MLNAVAPSEAFPHALGLLLALAMGGLTCIAAAVGVGALLRRRRRVASLALGLWGAVFAGYLAVLAGVSLSSRTRVVAPGDSMAFSGFYLDDHIHVRVAGASGAERVGASPREARPGHRFVVVAFEVSSDARRATLEPYDLQVTLVDPRGGRYGRDRAAEALLAGGVMKLEQPVGPGESYRRDLVFEVPADVAAGRLLVTEGDALERLIECFLVGDEDSLLHRRTFLDLGRF